MLTDDFSDYTFRCPVCGATDLAFVESGVKRYTQVVEIDPIGRIEWGEPETDPVEDARESWFQCMQCGHKLERNGKVIPGDDIDALLEWLRDSNASRSSY
jgi:hypothetical protein